MARFIRQVFRNNASLQITIPAELVKLYKLYNGDYIELDLIKNHRDKINE